MNDVNNRIFREFTEFFDNVEKSASEISVTTAYEITMKSTISTAIIVLESEGRLEERYWNHLRVQNNILDFLYNCLYCLQLLSKRCIQGLNLTPLSFRQPYLMLASMKALRFF